MANESTRPDALELPLIEAALCTHCDGTGIDDTLRGGGESCWYCFGTGEADNVRRYRQSSYTGFPAYTSKAKTSEEAPIKAACVRTGTPGKLLVGFAPGKVQAGKWNRDLDIDLDRLREEYEVDHVVCLVEDFELEMLKMRDYAQKCADRGMMLVRYPIKDGGIGKLDAVLTLALSMMRVLDHGGNVYVHCKGGLGRAGTIAACIALFADRSDDLTPEVIIKRVRDARSQRAIENKRQEQFVADFFHTYAC